MNEEILDKLYKCERCGKSDSSLRIAVFPYVFSILIVSFRRAWSGVFCAKCRKNEMAKAKLISLLFGWWGIPWGIIWTIGMLFESSQGKIPPETNADYLKGLGTYFVLKDDKIEAKRAFETSLEFMDNPKLRETLLQMFPSESIKRIEDEEIKDIEKKIKPKKTADDKYRLREAVEERIDSNNKLKINWNLPFNWKLPYYGAIGFAIGFFIMVTIGEVIGFTIVSAVGVTPGVFIMTVVYGAIFGAIGGAALGLALKDKKKTLYLSLAGAIGFAIGFVIGPFFSPNEIIYNSIIGAIGGAALGLALKDKKKTLYLSLAGAIGNGIVFIIIIDTIIIGDAIGSIIMGTALGLAFAYAKREENKNRIKNEKNKKERNKKVQITS